MERSFDLNMGPSICVFGSARDNLDPEYYKMAEEISSRAFKEHGYHCINGAGPGIMEAASKGAYQAGASSMGARIVLPFEQDNAKYIHGMYIFEKFYNRKCMLVRNAEVFIALPGGFGTMDELFEVLTLVQCGKLKSPRKIILVGKSFWSGLVDWIEDKMVGVTVNKTDMELFTVVDTVDEVMEVL